MPPRRGNKAPKLEDVVGIGAEFFADQLFDRAAQFLNGQRDRHLQAMPAEALSQAWDCMACGKTFPREQMEVESLRERVNPATGHSWGTCCGCFGNMWNSWEEKLIAMARARAAQAAAKNGVWGAATPGPAPGPRPTPGPTGPKIIRPWEILCVSQDATLEEVKKAYKRLAATCHPDIFPPGTPVEEVAAGRQKFEELTRAFKAMEKVRQVAK